MKNRRIIITAFFLLTCVLCTFGGNESLNSGNYEDKIFKQIIKKSLSENTLIHISLKTPKEWKLGSDDDLQIISDFPFTVEPTMVDYIAFYHRPSHSSIFISYKPLLGKSYFNNDTDKVAEWFKQAHCKIYNNRKIEIVEGSVVSQKREIGGKTFYVIRNEIITNKKEVRMIFVFLHIPDNLKSLYIFCFSAPKDKDIEKSDAFQTLTTIMSDFKPVQIDDYNEIFYRNYAKLWMFTDLNGDIEAAFYNAIKDETIREVKDTTAIKPESWEPHLILAHEYRSPYKLTLEEAKSLWGDEIVIKNESVWVWIGFNKGDGTTGKQLIRDQSKEYAPNPINRDGAIEEYKYLININPNFKNITKWVQLSIAQDPYERLNLEYLYREIISILKSAERYDEVIYYLIEGTKKIPSAEYLKSDLISSYEERAGDYEKKGDYHLALNDYKNILALERDSFVETMIREKMGDIYVKRGMKQEAISEYSKVLELLKKRKWDSTINDIEIKLHEIQKE